MPVWLQGIITIVAAVIASGATWATVRASNKKTEAEEAEILSRAALSLVEPMQKKIYKLECKIDDLEKEINNVYLWAKELSAQVIEHGGTPIPFSDIRVKRIDLDGLPLQE